MKSILKQIMAERGIKQSHFVKKYKISATTISALYRGESLPTLPTAYKIAKELGLHIDEIWFEDEESNG